MNPTDHPWTSNNRLFWSLTFVSCFFFFSGERDHGCDQPDDPPQPGALLQQVHGEEDEGLAVVLPDQPTRRDRHAGLPRQQVPAGGPREIRCLESCANILI